MLEAYCELRPASRAGKAVSALPAGHPELKARLSESLASLLVEHSAREVGRWLNVKGDTVAARGRSVRAWDLPDLMEIGQRFKPVANALRTYVNGEDVAQGHATSAVPELLREIHASGSLIASATTALSDGRVTSDEASDLLIELGRRREIEDAKLIPALTACIRD